MSARRYLMCRPTYFAVSYAINPWMDPAQPVDVRRAVDQWEGLRRTYLDLGHTVDLVEPVPELPDMVFAANGGLVVDGVAYGASFRHPERAGESVVYDAWFEQAGFPVVTAKEVNEGEGDLLLVGDVILAGTGFRTSVAAHRQVQELYGRPVIGLDLVDGRFYHLDTALTVLRGSDGTGRVGSDGVDIAYLPEAFTPGSRAVLQRLFPGALLAEPADAEVLGLNAASDGEHVVLPAQATALAQRLAHRGYAPVPVEIDELRKAGGGPKCCTLELRGDARVAAA